ncbi:MAG: glycosyltransferase family 39 protein, partial [Verrucomicrobia bacterium]|nr:glycosyltransferase family 39 protein [Verrucomicrobiota bacterium]
GNDTNAMLAWGRAWSGLIAVTLGLLVWRWSRQIFGPEGGMLSLLLYVLSPTVLANGALINADMASALGFLASVWCLWRVLQHVTVGRVLLSALVVGALFATKMSAVLILPVALILVVARLIDRRPLPVGPSRQVTPRLGRTAVFAAVAALHLALAVAVIWGLYGFRYSAFRADRPAGRFNYPWEWALDLPDPIAMLNRLNLSEAQRQSAIDRLVAHRATAAQWYYNAFDAMEEIRTTVLSGEQQTALATLREADAPGLPGRLVQFARRHRLLPEAFIFGYAQVWKLSHGRGAFLNGETRFTGWRHFFPYAALVKTPLAFFGLMAIALFALLRQRPPAPDRSAGSLGRTLAESATLPLGLLIGIYSAAAIMSQVNIGLRHILPVFPPLFILCGACVAWCPSGSPRPPAAGLRRFAPPILVLLVLGLAVETARWFPNYLAYFNGLVRPSQAYRHLVDSSLDWGQDLPAVRRYLDQHPNQGRTYFAYFGMDRPSRYGISATLIYGYLGIEVAAKPALKVLERLSVAADGAKIGEFLQREPAYDPTLISSVEVGGSTGVLLVKRPSELRLAAGTYLISATLVQPIYYPKAGGPWSQDHEQTYRRLLALVRPLLSDDPARATALESSTAAEWLQIFADFDEFRFARLTAFLRAREPADNIRGTVLVYHLTEADLMAALEGPPP